MKGVIDYYTDTKGYGFIHAEDGKKYFFHISNTEFNRSASESEIEGLQVTFNPVNSEKGIVAESVKEK